MREQLASGGIQWQPVYRRRSLRAAARVVELWEVRQVAGRLVRQHGLNVVHARSFFPGQIGLGLKRRYGVKLLYDMRGFWALEKRAKQTIRSDWLERTIQRREDRAFHEADALVSLTRAGVRYLRERGVKTPMEVIPTCVDLDRFTEARRESGVAPREFISVGSLGAGYLPDMTLAFFRAARRRWPGLRLRLVTRSEPELIHAAAMRIGCPLDDVTITALPAEAIPEALASADVGLCFVAPSVAKIASCPTKLGEYLATGLPVVANGDIGDVEETLEQHNIGIITRGDDVASLEDAVERLAQLLEDPQVHGRARRVAEQEFSMQLGAEHYLKMYRKLLAGQPDDGSGDGAEARSNGSLESDRALAEVKFSP